MTALHGAREAFIVSEKSEKIHRALNHNVRNSGNIKYIVYFKKANDRRWRSPGKVLGQDGQQMFVKYGSTYVRVHPCRLALARTTETTRQQGKNQKQQDTKISSKPNVYSKSEIADASNSESDDESAH